MHFLLTIATICLYIDFLISQAMTICDSQSAQPIDSLIEGFFSGSGVPGNALELANNFHAIISAPTQKFRKRAKNLVCEPDESCDSVQGVPFCYNTLTAKWHAADGTAGNAITGDYALLDGQVGNLYDGPLPVPHDGSSAKIITPVSQETGVPSGGSGAKENTHGTATTPSATNSPGPLAIPPATPTATNIVRNSGALCTSTGSYRIAAAIAFTSILSIGVRWLSFGK